MKPVKYPGVPVVVLGVAAMVIGGIFFTQGIAKNKLIVDRMNIVY